MCAFNERPCRVQIGPQLMARNARRRLNLQHPTGRDAVPLRNRLRRGLAPQRPRKARRAANPILGPLERGAHPNQQIVHAQLKAPLSTFCKQFFQ